jgi:hypothetical protein
VKAYPVADGSGWHLLWMLQRGRLGR